MEQKQSLTASTARTLSLAVLLEGAHTAPGTNYTVFAIGLLAAGSLGASVTVDAP